MFNTNKTVVLDVSKTYMGQKLQDGKYCAFMSLFFIFQTGLIWLFLFQFNFCQILVVKLGCQS